MHRLRSATAEALGLYRSGANAWLAVNVTGQYRDPQLQLLKRKIKFFRRFLKVFPHRREQFLARLVHRNWKSGAGITKQLSDTFSEVGWTWKDSQTMEHHSGLRMRWLLDSVPFVMNMLEKAWAFHVAAQIHRPNFDIDTFDARAFARCMKSRSARQQGILQTLACGKHVTMDGLVHYAERAESKQCPFCEADDGKEHQLFSCPAFADLRKNNMHVMKWLRRQKKAVWAFGHFPEVGKPLLLKAGLQVEGVLNMPPLAAEAAHVYTDGSAFYGECWDCCLAGAAAWIQNVEWGDGQPISALEMYFAFAMETGCMAPVQVKEKQYALRSDSVAADQFKLDLSRQSRVWLNFVSWWLEGVESPLHLTEVKALKHLGYPIVVRGFLQRPRLANSIAAQQELWKYFQQTIGFTIGTVIAASQLRQDYAQWRMTVLPYSWDPRFVYLEDW
eukprot:s1235_g16.t1